ncbi:MAG: hypothetical protein EBX74_02645 [Candidatus Fonsibacter lacus]|uniref:tRNA-uridine 2-sulfurtransferase n=1 Tax=Candidatus Fonsibacter lacus TaxID=2576439 RepID=A0A966HUC7_9PROT|nr:hypothetical protein [Candidatus Fonsibacter lacus]
MTTMLKTELTKNLLGLDKPPSETKVVVAMSGGVDSSVVAGLMKMNGYQVIGMTLQLYDYAQINKKPGTCCAGQDIYDAKRVSEKLDIDHYVLNYESKFKNEVIEKFADSYLRGETPIPCVNCNQTVKFRDLFESAKNLKADALITGHYVKKIIDNNISKMYRPKDLNRDQTYFLFATTQEQLNYLHFPLGDLPKEETRIIAKKLNLEVADKPDSQDICFVPDGKQNDFNENIFVKVRSTGKLIESKLDVNTGVVTFEKGEYGVSPGQACVFYKPDQAGIRVLGGGWIRATE